MVSEKSEFQRSRWPAMAVLVLSIASLGLSEEPASGDDAPKLWYRQPGSTRLGPGGTALDWQEQLKTGLPIGNGLLGAIIPGAVEDELIAINEHTLWSGRPVDVESLVRLDGQPRGR